MTNAMIIFKESVKLMEQGVLKGTGEFITVEEEDGTARQLEMPEPIHTFQKWKELGYSVKKGEKSNIKFSIWKHSAKSVTNEETGEETEKTSMFMKTAAFFRFEQVEPIAVKN